MSGAEASFYVTGGTLRYDAPSYVERQADRELLGALLKGEFCYVLTSRQMGKSSLMVRTAQKLREHQIHVVVLDLTAIGQNLKPEQWYDGLLARIGQGLQLETELETFWRTHERIGPCQRLFAALSEVVLKKPDVREKIPQSQFTIFVDEIDTVRSLPFSTDEFFAAVRECYNRRSVDVELNRLTFCLLGVATPSDLIRDTRTTPFNIGRRIELTDFSEGETAPLVNGLARMESSLARTVLHRIHEWTGGHPYLTQRLCEAAADDPGVLGPGGVDRMCARLFLTMQAREQDDNLIFVRERVLRTEADLAGLLSLYRQVLTGKSVRDDPANPLVPLLRLAGVTRPVNGYLEVRNRIYQRVFDTDWVAQNMPDAEMRRQRAAFRRGLFRATGVAALVIAALASVLIFAAMQAHRAQTKAEESRARLIRLNVSNGVHLMEQGDLADSLCWFVEALQLDKGQPAQERIHRVRIGSILRQGLQLVRLLPHSTEASIASSDARYVLVTDRTGTRIWDVPSDKTVGPRLEKIGNFIQLTVSSDGQRFATLGIDPNHGTDLSRVWETATGKLISTSEHSEAVGDIAFSLDGQRLVATSPNAVQVYDANTGKVLTPSLPRSLNEPHPPRFTSDGRKLVVFFEDTLDIWSSLTGERIVQPLKHEKRITDANFNPKESLIVTASADQTARVWDAKTGMLLFPPLIHNDSVSQAQFSPDGTLLLTVCDIANRSPIGSEAETLIWDAATGKQIGPAFKHGSRIQHAEFSPDGRHVVTACADGTARVWSIDTGQPIAPPMQHSESVSFATFSPDGRRVATASYPFSSSGETQARVWDALTGKAITPSLRQRGDTLQVLFSGDGDRLFTKSENETRVWDLVRDQLAIQRLEHTSAMILSAAFSPDGKRIATGGSDQIARIWDTASGTPIGAPIKHKGSVHQVVFSPDGKRLASGSQDGVLQISDTETGRPLFGPLQHDSAVTHLEFSHDGLQLLVGTGLRYVRGGTGEARIWSVRTGEAISPPLLKQTNGGAVYPTFSPDGRQVLAAAYPWSLNFPSEARVFDVATGRPASPSLKHPGVVAHAAFSPDGRTAVTACYDGAARIWNVETGGIIAPLLRHRGPVNDTSFSPGGRAILTASSDRTVRLWNANTGEPLSPPLQHGTDVSSAWFSPDGILILSISGKVVRLWHAIYGELITASLRHDELITDASFGPDGRLILTAGQDGIARVWNLTPVDYQLHDLERLVQILSNRRMDATGGLVPLNFEPVQTPLDKALETVRPALPRVLTKDEPISSSWEALRSKYSAQFSFDPEWKLRWHEQEAKVDEQERQWFAAAFHLNCLLATRPNDPTLGRRHALTSARNGGWTKIASAQPELAEIVRPRDPRVPNALVDLSDYYNAFLAESWNPESSNGSDLSALPFGVQKFQGIDFDVRGIVQLAGGSTKRDRFPQAVKRIKMNRKANRLHFLHATSFATSDGSQIGAYMVHYSNGEQIEIPIVYGLDVRDWVDNVGESQKTSRSEVAWVDRSNGLDFRLYKSTWNNPRSELEIESLDFVSNMAAPAPFLVALTAEP